MSQSDYAARQTQANVVELIRGEHYLVFTDGAVLPDEGAIEELRILAYVQRKKPTLGPENAQEIETLAEAVATGVLTNVVWAGCQEAKRLVDKLRARRRKPIRDAGEAERHALEASLAPQIPVTFPPALEVMVAGTGADGTTWKFTCVAGEKPVEMRMDVSGTVIDVIIGRR